MRDDAQLASEPTARNSKRFPVKANGEVRLVGIIDHQLRNFRDIQLHTLLASQGEEFFLVCLLDMVEQVGELLAEE